MTSTELVRMDDAPVVPLDADEATFLERISMVRHALEVATTADEIRSVRDVAMKAQVIAAALESKQAAMAAGELRLRAERAAGAVRAQLARGGERAGQPMKRTVTPERIEIAKKLRADGASTRRVAEAIGSSKTTVLALERNNWQYKTGRRVPTEVHDFDGEFGIKSQLASHWERLADMAEQDFDAQLRCAIRDDLALGTVAFLNRYHRIGEVKVARNIYRRPDGDLTLRWNKGSVPFNVRLKHGDLERARTELAVARGNMTAKSGKAGGALDGSQEYVIKALEALSRADTSKLDQEAKRDVDQARAFLHKAKDHIIRALAVA